MTDYAPVLASMLALATALIAYTGIIQKEREHGRQRPLFSVRFGLSGTGSGELVVTNDGGQPALGVRVDCRGERRRLDVMKVGEGITLPVTSIEGCELAILYRGLSKPPRKSVRRFGKAAGGGLEYLGGHDEALGLLNRIKVEY